MTAAWTDMWLTPGSVILQRLSVPTLGGGDGYVGTGTTANGADADAAHTFAAAPTRQHPPRRSIRGETRHQLGRYRFGSHGNGGGDGSGSDGSGGGGGSDGGGKSIETLATSIAAGKLFKTCAADVDESGEPPIYVSRNGQAVRVHSDGSTTPVCHMSPAFYAQTLSSSQVSILHPTP